MKLNLLSEENFRSIFTQLELNTTPEKEDILQKENNLVKSQGYVKS